MHMRILQQLKGILLSMVLWIEEGFFDKKDELKKLEKKWLEKLQPYGERGYHKEK